jgi:hypothetical protein
MLRTRQRPQFAIKNNKNLKKVLFLKLYKCNLGLNNLYMERKTFNPNNIEEPNLSWNTSERRYNRAFLKKIKIKNSLFVLKFQTIIISSHFSNTKFVLRRQNAIHKH